MTLALKRKCGQAIKIGESIVVTIGETRGSYTTVLVDAPREIPIQRIEGESANDNANNTGAVPRQRRRH